MRYAITAGLLAAFSLPCMAQSRKADSLRTIIARPARDTIYYRSLALLADHYSRSKPDSARFYANAVLSGPADNKQLFRFRASAFNSIGYAGYVTGKYADAISAFKEFFRWSERAGDKSGMAYAVNNEGNVHIDLGDYGTALERYRQALAIRQSIGDTKGIAMSYNNIGYIYKDLGDYDKAAASMLAGLRLMESLGDKALIASTLNMIGAVYARKKDYAQAAEYQQRALGLQRALDNPAATGISLQMLGNIYGEQGDYARSLEYNNQALDLYTKAGDVRQIATVNGNIAELLTRQEKFDASIPYYTKAIEGAAQIGYRRALANFWMGQAVNRISLRQLPDARILLDSATALIQQTGNKEYLRTLYELESKYHAALGEHKTALDYAVRFAAQKDTLLNEANIKAMSDMSVKYETEKKEAQITLLDKESAIQQLQLNNQRLQLDQQLFRIAQGRLALSEADLKIANGELQIRTQNETILAQQLDAAQRAKRIDSLRRQAQLQTLELRNRKLEVRQRNGVIGGLAGIFLLGGMLGYSYYRRAQLKAAARLHESVLQQQAAATKAILEAEEGERSRIAKDLHDGVGQMMSAAKMNLSAYESDNTFRTPEERIAFERIISLVDESCKEVRAVSHNMMPNALLKNSLAAAIREFISQIDQRMLKVHLYTEGLDERLDANTEAVLYRVIQECVNNVIKHSGANALDISLVKEASEITATVEDNGRGFDMRRKSKTLEGIGLKNIRTRIDYLKGTVDFDTAPGRGTVVAIHVPLT